MRVFQTTLAALVSIVLLSCGGKQPGETAEGTDGNTDSAFGAERDTAEQAAVDDAKQRIRNWLSSDIAQKVQESAKKAGKNLGTRLAADPEVINGAKTLTASVLKEKSVKPKLDAIEEQATRGFGKKLSLGWKALKAGGLDEFKAKVAADAQRVGMEVLADHLKNDVLKDARFGAFFKEFSHVIKLQGQVAAVALQENLSPKVNSMILSIALRFAAAGGNRAVAERVDSWIAACEEDATGRVEAMIDDVALLPSVHDGLRSLALDVLSHERTRLEIVAMFNTLLDIPEVSEALVGVYEAAAFEKGDAEIRKAMEKVLAVEAVDTELFALLKRLSEAEGAGEIIGRNLKKVGDDPKLAVLVEDFIISILETCGDPSGN